MTLSVPPTPATTVRYRNAAEWVHGLGDVPLDRIIVDPWPGTATEEDLLRKVEVDKQLCELIDGTLVEKPMGWKESMIAARLIKLLLIFVEPRRLGFVTGEAGTIRLAKGLIRIPDVAFISASRLPGGKPPTEPIPSLAPDLAVEVLSKTNTAAEMKRKVREYFDAGVGAVWLIDLEARSATIFNAVAKPETVREHELLRGAGALSGFEARLADLFAEL
jgi:Uma2 family endonuclease